MSNVTSALRATAGDNILAGRYVPRKSPAALVTSSRRTIRISGAIEAQRLPYAVAEPPRPSSILSVCAARPRLIRLHFGHITGRWPACSALISPAPDLSPRLSAVGKSSSWARIWQCMQCRPQTAPKFEFSAPRYPSTPTAPATAATRPISAGQSLDYLGSRGNRTHAGCHRSYPSRNSRSPRFVSLARTTYESFVRQRNARSPGGKPLDAEAAKSRCWE